MEFWGFCKPSPTYLAQCFFKITRYMINDIRFLSLNEDSDRYGCRKYFVDHTGKQDGGREGGKGGREFTSCLSCAARSPWVRMKLWMPFLYQDSIEIPLLLCKYTNMVSLNLELDNLQRFVSVLLLV